MSTSHHNKIEMDQTFSSYLISTSNVKQNSGHHRPTEIPFLDTTGGKDPQTNLMNFSFENNSQGKNNFFTSTGTKETSVPQLDDPNPINDTKGKSKDEFSIFNSAAENHENRSETNPTNPIIENPNENSSAWYSKFDTAWYFSTARPDKKKKSKKSKRSNRSKQSRETDYEYDNESQDEFISEPISNEERERRPDEECNRSLINNEKHDKKNVLPPNNTIRTSPPSEVESNTDLVSNSDSSSSIDIKNSNTLPEKTFQTPIYYESHHLNPNKFWVWKKPISLCKESQNIANFDDLFITQKDYEISIRTKITQCILLFILFLQSIIFLRNGLYNVAIGILIVIWVTLFYFIIRSCFEVKKQIW